MAVLIQRPTVTHIESRPFSPPTSAGQRNVNVAGLEGCYLLLLVAWHRCYGCRNRWLRARTPGGERAKSGHSELRQAYAAMYVRRISHDRINEQSTLESHSSDVIGVIVRRAHSQRNAEAIKLQNQASHGTVTCYRGCRDISTLKVPKINSRTVQRYT